MTHPESWNSQCIAVQARTQVQDNRGSHAGYKDFGHPDGYILRSASSSCQKAETWGIRLSCSCNLHLVRVRSTGLVQMKADCEAFRINHCCVYNWQISSSGSLYTSWRTQSELFLCLASAISCPATLLSVYTQTASETYRQVRQVLEVLLHRAKGLHVNSRASIQFEYLQPCFRSFSNKCMSTDMASKSLLLCSKLALFLVQVFSGTDPPLEEVLFKLATRRPQILAK